MKSIFRNTEAWGYQNGLSETILRVLQQTYDIKQDGWNGDHTAILYVRQAHLNERPIVNAPDHWSVVDLGGRLAVTPINASEDMPLVPVADLNASKLDVVTMGWTIAARIWRHVIGEAIAPDFIYHDAPAIEAGRKLWPTRGQFGFDKELLAERAQSMRCQLKVVGDCAVISRRIRNRRTPIESYRYVPERQEPYTWVMSGYRPDWQPQP